MASNARIPRKRTCTRVKIKSDLLNSWLESVMNLEFSNAEKSRCEKYLSSAAETKDPGPISSEDKEASNKIDVVQMINTFRDVSHDADISTYEVLTSLSKFTLLHNLTKKCSDDLVRLVSTLMPKSGVCFPALLDSVAGLIPNFPGSRVLAHCPGCLAAVSSEEQQCLGCGEVIVGDKVGSVQNDLAAVLKHLLEHSELAKLLAQHHNKNKADLLKDLTDGLRYKSLPRETPFDLSLVLNAHTFTFCPGGASKRFTVLSTFFTIAELEPVLRRKFVLLHSIWIFPISSDRNVKSDAFASLCKTLNELSTRGVEWKHPISLNMITSKAHLLFAAVDRQLRNVMQCLDAHSCSFCEHSGCPLQGSDERVYPFTGKHELMRTHANILRHALKGSGGKGVTGCSPFFFLSNFDVVNGFSAEYQNTVLMAVVKQTLTLCLSEAGRDKDYHLKSDAVTAILLDLSSGQIPNFVDSQQSGLDNVCNWTDTECRNWLLFYSVACLEQVWPEKLFEHHLLLVQAVHNLLKDRISEDELVKTQLKLEEYCQAFAGHFGVQAMTLDVHNLLHLVRSVRQCGPLWSSSVSAFGQSHEFVSEAFSRLKCHPSSQVLKNLAEHINQHANLQLVCGVQDQKRNTCVLSGVVTDLKPELVAYLQDTAKIDVKKATFYSRVKMDGFVLDTKEDGASFFQYQMVDIGCRRWAKLLCLCNLVGKNGEKEHFFLASTVPKRQENTSSLIHMSRFVDPEVLPAWIWLKLELIKAPLFLVGNFLCVPPNLQLL